MEGPVGFPPPPFSDLLLTEWQQESVAGGRGHRTPCDSLAGPVLQQFCIWRKAGIIQLVIRVRSPVRLGGANAAEQRAFALVTEIGITCCIYPVLDAEMFIDVHPPNESFSFK